EVVALGVTLLAIAALFQLADAMAMVNLHTLIGAGDTRFTMLASVGCSWFVQVPVSLVLVVLLGWGAVGAWLGLTAEIFVLAAITLVRIRSNSWLEVKLGRSESVDAVPVDAMRSDAVPLDALPAK
ncbi:MAG: MATE family multidrug resistance protein, partial [Kiritimatiellia bacterium]